MINLTRMSSRWLVLVEKSTLFSFVVMCRGNRAFRSQFGITSLILLDVVIFLG